MSHSSIRMMTGRPGRGRGSVERAGAGNSRNIPSIPAVGLAAVLLACLASPGCTQARRFECASSQQCVQGEVQGTCEPDGACSFPDPMCDSGRRFEDSAGGACVEGEACGAPGQSCCDGVCDDGASCQGDVCVTGDCGGVGQACCPGDTCGVNASCQSGTCQQCVVDVAHGRRHGCAVEADGTVWCWGDNGSGQLGNGTQNSSLTPVQVAMAQGGPLTDATRVSAGKDHTCALRSDGTVWCWGSGDSGRLGNGATNDSPTAVQVTVDATQEPLADVADFQVGDCFSCARTQDRRVLCWGCGGGGRLGNSATGNQSRAVPVVLAAGGAPLDSVEQIGAAVQACALRDDDTVLCWGPNNQGEVGDGTTGAATAAVQVLTDSKHIAVGRRTTCAARNDGSVFCWGDSWRGRAGDGGPSPIQIVQRSGAPFTGAAALTVGSVSCALTDDTQAWCWGTSNYGQTGNGTGAPTPAPVLRPEGDQPLSDVVRLVAGYAHVCAFLADGGLLCWGRNVQGDLGDGTRINRGFPTPLALQCQ